MITRVSLSVALVLLGLATSHGQTADVRDDPQFEAKSFALEISGELLPPIGLTDQIDGDLRLIRAFFPIVADIRGTPNWAPGEAIVTLTEMADAEYQNGEFTGFESLAPVLGRPNVRRLPLPQVLLVSFGKFYHPDRLAEMILAIDGVASAGPDSLAIGDTDIEARADRSYAFSREHIGSLLSGRPSGVYEFSVTEKAITLWSQPGSDVPIVVQIPEPSSLWQVVGAIACGYACRSRCNATSLK